MVLDHLCVAGRLAVAATSVRLRSACVEDPICAAVGWSVLGAGVTGTHWWQWRWPDANHPKPPLVDRPVAARQGRAIFDILHAVQTLDDAWHGWEAAKSGGSDLLAWVDHLLAAHPPGEELADLADCRSCRHHGVSTDALERLWGIRMEGTVLEFDCQRWFEGPAGDQQLMCDVWAVLKVAFLCLESPTLKHLDSCKESWGMPVELPILSRRARRSTNIRRLAQAHKDGGGLSVAAGAVRRPVRRHFGLWVQLALRATSGPVALYFDGALTVRSPDVAVALGFLATVYDGVMDSWPVLALSRRCSTHWPAWEQHVVYSAIEAADKGTSYKSALSEAIGHAACVGSTRLCIAWGRRAGPAVILPPRCDGHSLSPV